MGIKTRTVTDYYCDVCEAQCEPTAYFQTTTHPGDGNLGRSYVYMVFHYHNPMQAEAECVICKKCQKDYLRLYLAHLEGDLVTPKCAKQQTTK